MITAHHTHNSRGRGSALAAPPMRLGGLIARGMQMRGRSTLQCHTACTCETFSLNRYNYCLNGWLLSLGATWRSFYTLRLQRLMLSSYLQQKRL